MKPPVPLLALAIACLPAQPLLELARSEQPQVIDTLRQLVEIESPSSDRAGLDRIAAFIAARLQSLGGEINFHEPPPDAVRLQGLTRALAKR